MILVIYHWQVADDNRAAFIDAWQETTQLIHKNTEGALGSVCLSPLNDASQIMTIARWSNRTLWQNFIWSAKTGKMNKMHKLGKLTDTVLCNEIGDYLIKQ